MDKFQNDNKKKPLLIGSLFIPSTVPRNICAVTLNKRIALPSQSNIKYGNILSRPETLNDQDYTTINIINSYVSRTHIM
jgi:hypothetical protein